MATLKMPAVRYELIRMEGGLDQVTPTLALPPGVARRAANFECDVNGGYRRIDGYERFDGRISPSDARYNVLSVELTGEVNPGDTLIGQGSGASGLVIAVTDDTIVLTRETGVFVATDPLLVGTTVVGVINDILGVAADGRLDAEYRNRAADEYRQDIGPVPGSGPVRGVAYYNGTVYAWRDTSDGQTTAIHKSTPSGWAPVPLGFELAFKGGSVQIYDGDTVTGGTSGATATVSRVVMEDGSWASEDAKGRLILSVLSGSFTADEDIVVDGVAAALASSEGQAITLQPGGKVDTVLANFGGGIANYRLYGCDGVNRAFEFDGQSYVPIRTGMDVDAPEHVVVHKQHLFLSFGSSLQFSAIGDPYQWTPLLGAGEIALRAPITNLISLPGDQSSGALAVYTRRDTSVLYGTSAQTFQLSDFNTGTGGIAHTAQNMDQTYALDDRGVMALATSLNFGNFDAASLTMNLRPFLRQRLNLAVGSTVSREKGQYRVFFSDGTALYLTVVNGQPLGAMPIYMEHRVSCATEGESPAGTARMFFGSPDGFVYELDRGSSFDGEPIQAGLTLVFSAIGSPRIRKRYRRASIELTGDAYAEIFVSYDLGYRTPDIDQPDDVGYSNDLRSAYWDEFTWDSFVWDARDLSPVEVDMNGTAENIALRISSSSDLFRAFTINSVILHYSMRRGIR